MPTISGNAFDSRSPVSSMRFRSSLVNSIATGRVDFQNCQDGTSGRKLTGKDVLNELPLLRSRGVIPSDLSLGARIWPAPPVVSCGAHLQAHPVMSSCFESFAFAYSIGSAGGCRRKGLHIKTLAQSVQQAVAQLMSHTDFRLFPGSPKLA